MMWSRDQEYARYGLTHEQGVEADKWMNGPMNAMPKPLYAMLVEAGHRRGISGDVIWECIVACVKGLTLDEYLKS